MMKRYLLPATPLAAMLLLTGCMDDNYDLENIDTTTEVKVNDLIIPVNVNDVTLNSVIDLDDDSDVKKEIDPATGKEIYVYSYKGTFNSDAINIEPFAVTAPVLSPETIEVNLASPAQAPARRAAAEAVHYKVKELNTTFDYVLHDIDDAVKSVKSLSTPSVTYKTVISFPSTIVANSDKIEVTDLNIQFPKGLVMAPGSPSIGTYDPATGIVKIADYVLPADGKLRLDLESTRVLVDEPVVNGSLTYSDAITVLDGGDLMISPKVGTQLDPTFVLATDYRLSSFDVTAFSGSIVKPIDGFDGPSILLNDLPDFLSQDGTNLILANPQLYLEVNNPLSQYQVEARTGVSLTPVRGSQESAAIVLPGGLTIADNKPAGAIYKYVLSPDGAATVPVAGYEDAEKLPYPGLGNVLAGNGLPEKLNVDFSNPEAFGDNVTDFPLTGNIPGIEGAYTFRAPLALEPGTTIYYSGTKNDWGSEDLDRLHVSEMHVTATATSDLPVGVLLSAQVVTTSGQHVGVCEPLTLPAMAQDYPITLTIKAAEGTEIDNIDGIYYHVTCAVNDNDPAAGEAISPEQTVVLKTVRARVTGRYLYEDK